MNYYDKFAQDYSQNTLKLDMSHLYGPFLDSLPANAKILDVGCGPGRDLKYFENLGFKVVGIDPSAEMVRLAKEFSNANVIQGKIEDVNFDNEFDGIWACASLLHIPSANLPDVFAKISTLLKLNGAFFCCFKLGQFEGIREDGRYFTYLNDESLTKLVSQVHGLVIQKIWVSNDARDDKSVSWINCLMIKEIFSKSPENIA
jgi:SAM-dependent methyltransferase